MYTVSKAHSLAYSTCETGKERSSRLPVRKGIKPVDTCICVCVCVYVSNKHQFLKQKPEKEGKTLNPHSIIIHTLFSTELTRAEGPTTESSKESREERTRRKARPKDWWRVKGWEQVRRSRSHNSPEAGARKSTQGKKRNKIRGEWKCINGRDRGRKGQY